MKTIEKLRYILLKLLFRKHMWNVFNGISWIYAAIILTITGSIMFGIQRHKENYFVENNCLVLKGESRYTFMFGIHDLLCACMDCSI